MLRKILVVHLKQCNRSINYKTKNHPRGQILIWLVWYLDKKKNQCIKTLVYTADVKQNNIFFYIKPNIHKWELFAIKTYQLV